MSTFRLIGHMFEYTKKRRALYITAALISLAAVFAIFFMLKRPAVTMTSEWLTYSENGVVTVAVPEGEEPVQTADVEANNYRWSLYENGVLYFEPIDSANTYTLAALSNAASAPWYDYSGQITAVKFAGGLEAIGNYSFGSSAYAGLSAVDLSECGGTLTTIGTYVFDGCSALTDVNFGDGSALTSIGNYAFRNCTLLSQIPFEQFTALESIGTYAFYKCESLQSVDLSNTKLTSISNYTFYYCSGLNSVYFGENSPITSIGNYAFAYCSELRQFPFDQITNLNSTGTYVFAYCKSLQAVDLSKNTALKSIANGTFNYCSALNSIDFGENSPITSIGSSAFRYCGSLKDLDLKDLANLSNIGTYAFADCYALETVDASASMPDMKTGLNANVFFGCTSLKTVDLSGMTELTSIPNYAFAICTELEKLILPENSKITSIGQSSFANCTSLKDFPFDDLTSLTTLYGGSYNSSNSTVNGTSYTVYYGSFAGSGLTSADLSSTALNNIASGTFFNCTSLEKLKIGPAVKKIDAYAFTLCTSLHEVDAPDDNVLESIGMSAFAYCTSLEKFSFEKLTKLTTLYNGSNNAQTISVGGKSYKIYYGVFTNSGLTSIDLSKTALTNTYTGTFAYCDSLSKIKLGENIQTVGAYAFYYCTALESLDAGAMPGVTAIETYAFEYCTALESIESGAMPALISIGNYAFAYDSALQSIESGAMPALTTIGERAFYYCTAFESLDLGEAMPRLASIGAYAFAYCTSMQSLNIGALPELTSIGNYAFAYNSELTDIVFNASQLTSTGNYVFYNCTSLNSVTFKYKDALTAIGNYAFSGCSSLTEFDFSQLSSLKSVGNYAFAYCSGLENLIFNNNELISLGQFAFQSCKALVTADLSGLPELSGSLYGTFFGCTSLKELDFADNCKVTSLEYAAFYNCTSLTSFPFDKFTELKSITSSSSNYCVFYSCKLTGLDLTKNTKLETIKNAFYNCNSIKKVDLTGVKSLNTIGDYAFYCSSIQTASFKGCTGLTTLAATAFYNGGSTSSGTNNSTLSSVDFSGCSSLKSIPSRAFRGFTALRKFDLTGCDSLATISSDAFYNCTELREITLPKGLTTIGANAFYNCYLIKTINYEAKNITSAASTAFSKVGYSTSLTVNIGKSVDRICEDLFASSFKVKKVLFKGENDSLIIGSGALRSLGRPLSDMSDGTTEYYVDEYGVLFSKDKTKLYYIPSGLTEYTIPSSVTTVMGSSCRLASDLKRVIFEDINKITELEAEAFADCKTLSEIVSGATTATTIANAKKLFESANAKVGANAFKNTGLAGEDEEQLTSETVSANTYVNGSPEYELSVSFMDRDDHLAKNQKQKNANSRGLDPQVITKENYEENNYLTSIDPDETDDDVFYYLTDELAKFNINLSAFAAGADHEAGEDKIKYARVFCECSSDDFIFGGYTLNVPVTVRSSSSFDADGKAIEYLVTLKRAGNTGIYYFEFAISHGNTVSFDVNTYIKNLTVQNATMRVWADIVESQDAPLALSPKKFDDQDKAYYQQASWYTAIRKWSVRHSAPTSEYGFEAAKTNDDIYTRINSSIQFTISSTISGSSSKAKYGIDPTKARSYTEWLTLPTGVEWKPQIKEAIKNGNYYVSSSTSIIVNTPSGNINVATLSTAVNDLSVKWDDEKNTPVITWTIKNTKLAETQTSDANYEMASLTYYITYNAPSIFEITDEYDLAGEKMEGKPNDKEYQEAHCIFSTVVQNPEYVFAEEGDTKYHDEDIFEQTDDTYVMLGTASPIFSISKKATTTNSNNSTATGGTDVTYTITSKNTGAVPGTVKSVYDTLPERIKITPYNIERMLYDDDNYCDELTITITNWYKANGVVDNKKTMTGTDGKDIDITAEKIASSATRQTTPITITRAVNDEGELLNHLVLTYGTQTILIGEGNGMDFPTVQEYFDSINFINNCTTSNTSSTGSYYTTYRCDWVMKDTTLDVFEERVYKIYATAKTTFEVLQRDYDSYYYNSSQSNTAYLEHSTGKPSGSCSVTWDYDWRISKSWKVNGTSSATKVANGDVIDWTVTVQHYGDSTQSGIPVWDEMTGAQCLLVPVEENQEAYLATTDKSTGESIKLYLKDMELEIVEDSTGKQYYMLSETGTYRDVWVGTDNSGNLLKTDRITVSRSGIGRTTKMYWYLDTITGSQSYKINYKSVVDDKAGGDLNKGDFTLNNKAWLGEMASRRLYYTTSTMQFVSSDFEKVIVTENIGTDDEVTTDHTEIAKGDKVTYKLTLYNYTEYDKPFEDVYDILPETYDIFEWSKDNVEIMTISDTDEGKNSTAEEWKISTILPANYTGDKIYKRHTIYWNEIAEEPDPDSDNWEKEYKEYVKSGIVLKPNETLYIYVTCQYPEDDDVWNDYQEAAFEEGNSVVNGFYVDGKSSTVDHSLKAQGLIYMQKGVYGVYNATSMSATGSYVTNIGSRTEYVNRAVSVPIVTYYVTIYNAGNARFYLTDMTDVLPKGFVYRGMCSATDYGTTGESTSVNGNRKANNSSTNHSDVILSYACTGGTSNEKNNVLSPVTDTALKETENVKYMSSYITCTTSSTKNGDEYFQKMKLSFNKKYNTYTSANVGYDPDLDMCYLEKGQAISFGYTAYVPAYKYTEDIAKNTVSMQYYDYNDAGFKVADTVSVAGQFSNYLTSTNDGRCDTMTNFEATTSGYTDQYGGTDWLTSSVELTRGYLAPGVTKTVNKKIDMQGNQKTCENGILEYTDIPIWTMEFSNTGTKPLTKYTITDTMQAPYYFTGDLTYTVTSAQGKVYSSTNYPSTTSSTPNRSNWYTNYANKLLFDITFKDSNGDAVTSPLDYNKKDEYQVSFKTMYNNTVGNYNTYVIGLGLGEEDGVKCQSYWYASGALSSVGPESQSSSIYFTVKFDIDKDNNCILQLIFDDDTPDKKDTHGYLGIEPGGKTTMTVQTRQPETVSYYDSYINNVMLTPEQYYDPDTVKKGSLVTDKEGNVEGIESQAMVSVTGAYSTTSWKTIEDDSDTSNNASSRSVDNYITLKWDENEYGAWTPTSPYPPCSTFTYTLNVQNLCQGSALNRMVIIDYIPEEGDHATYSDENSPRKSEFTVGFADIIEEYFAVYDDDTELKRIDVFGENDPEELSYTIEFSKATEFKAGDWEGHTNLEDPDDTVEWVSFEKAKDIVEKSTKGIKDPKEAKIAKSNALKQFRSFRIIAKGGKGIAVNHVFSVKAKARIYGVVEADEIAWNNFGYRYSVPTSNSFTVLSASSLNVGIMTATAPKLKKLIKSATGEPITAEEINASAEFIAYHGDEISYRDVQDLLKQLKEQNRDFTVIKFTADQIDEGKTVVIDGYPKYKVVENDGKYSYALNDDDEIFVWNENDKYTFTEINISQYLYFSKMSLSNQTSTSNSFTITYVRNGNFDIVCENIYDDYSIELTKQNASDRSVLADAGFARYGIITGDPDDAGYKNDVEQLWRENLGAYIDAVNTVNGITDADSGIYALNTPAVTALDPEIVSYSDFARIRGAVTELADTDNIGQSFSQLYTIKNGDGTVTTYYFLDYSTTNAGGTISYPSVIDECFGFVEVVAPKGFTLQYKIERHDRDHSSTKNTVKVNDTYAPAFPITGGSGRRNYLILSGIALMLFSTVMVVIRVRRKGGQAA